MSDASFTFLIFLYMAILGFIFGKSFTEPEQNVKTKKISEKQMQSQLFYHDQSVQKDLHK